MLLIERYLAREILRPVLGVFTFLLVVVLVFYASRLLASAAVENLPMDLVLRMAGLRLGLFLDTLLPIALLLGVVIGLGRLQNAHEIVALAAVGAGRRRILMALGLWVLLLALVAAALSMVFRPWAYATIYELERQAAAEFSLDRVEPGRFQVGDQQWLIYAAGREGNQLTEVMVHQRHPDYSGVMRAQRLSQIDEEDGLIRLRFDGEVRSYRISQSGERDLTSRFEQFDVVFQGREPPRRDQLRRAMSTKALWDSDLPIEQAELHWRLVSPLSVMVLALAGVAMSRVNPRLGQSTRVLTASLIGTLYFSGLGVVINWLEQGSWPTWPGAFILPMAVLLLLGIRYWVVQRGPGAPL